MNRLERRRLYTPLLTWACGLVLTIAAAAAAGWEAALPVAVATAVPALAYWWVGGTDSDFGAMMSCRADERQSMARLWARAFAALALLVVAVAGTIVAIASNASVWPFLAIAALGAVCFAAGLAFYRRRARLASSGFALRIGRRLDERDASSVLHALQLAGIVMFVVAAIGGAALGGVAGDVALRLLALAFVVSLLAGLAIFRSEHHA
jgi:hypothetical protein